MRAGERVVQHSSVGPQYLHVIVFLAACACAALIAMIVLATGRQTQNMIFARTTVSPMLSGASVTAGYGELRNAGDKPDKLLRIESEVVNAIELHESINKNGIAHMQRITLPIVLEAGETLELRPGRKHLMMFATTRRFVSGEKVPLTFVFERAGPSLTMAEVG
ncbi:MAG: copper chaperone PCu(A)C [Rhodanobacteraceae bacterium]|nr:copper chaperone PCu(A)C [Rhodanobacteraceae bacterium]